MMAYARRCLCHRDCRRPGRHALRSNPIRAVGATILLALGIYGPTVLAQPAPGPTSILPSIPPRSPAATTADFRWLVGTWRGQLAGSSAQITVAYTQPDAGVMTGVMRLVDHGAVQVVELITLIDAPGGVELRFRHFSSTLEAMETTYRQSMRLTTHEVARDVFENTVPFEKGVISTEPRTTALTQHGTDEFVGHTDIINDDGKPAVIEVTYHRVP
jgi:hypothetical protein